MKLLRVLPILAHLGEGDSWMSLEPEPPQVASINEYIVLANREKELRYLCFDSSI